MFTMKYRFEIFTLTRQEVNYFKNVDLYIFLVFTYEVNVVNHVLLT